MSRIRYLAVVLAALAGVFTGVAVLADEPVDGRPGRAEVRFLEGMIDHHQMALDMAHDCLAKAETSTVRTLCQNIITAQSREILSMRGWLLSWYGIDYEPVSMLHAASHAAQALPEPGGMGMMGGGMMHESMGMMSDMAGMMARMAGMMSSMSSMMDMMHGGIGMMQGSSTPAAPAQSGDHGAHHPQGSAAQSAPDQRHGADQGHPQHSDAGAPAAPADPPMTMGMFAGLNALSARAYEIAWLEAMIDHHDDALHMARRILEQAPEAVSHAQLRRLAERIISDQSAEIEAMEALITTLGG